MGEAARARDAPELRATHERFSGRISLREKGCKAEPGGDPHTHAVHAVRAVLCSQDLERAQVDLADALFVLADQQAADPGAEDEANAMQLLSAGQYFQVCVCACVCLRACVRGHGVQC